MKDIKIIFDFDQEVTFSQFSNLIYHMNSAFNMSKRIDSILAKKLFNVDEFSEYDLSEISRQIIEKRWVRNDNPVLIQKITMNSPIEITINIDCYVHIAIILLGGRRTGSDVYKMSKEIIKDARKKLNSLRNIK
jgi:hypothetical protein